MRTGRPRCGRLHRGGALPGRARCGPPPLLIPGRGTASSTSLSMSQVYGLSERIGLRPGGAANESSERCPDTGLGLLAFPGEVACCSPPRSLPDRPLAGAGAGPGSDRERGRRGDADPRFGLDVVGTVERGGMAGGATRRRAPGALPCTARASWLVDWIRAYRASRDAASPPRCRPRSGLVAVTDRRRAPGASAGTSLRVLRMV